MQAEPVVRADAAHAPGAQPLPSVFRHEVMLYAGLDDFVSGTCPFIRDGAGAGEPTLVVVSAAKIGLLREALGPEAAGVAFADMAQVGRNPARIIPMWREFVSANAEARRPLRGIGEPIWAGRSETELVECERDEALLNVAFEGVPGFWLLCPYDVTTLDAKVLAEAQRNHPFVTQDGSRRASPLYRGLEDAAAPFDAPLQDPPAHASELAFTTGSLDRVRRFASSLAQDARLDQIQTADLVLAVNEVAANSLRYAGGAGKVLGWRDGETVVCEVRDAGRIADPLVGRSRPASGQERGRGLWLVNQLCDLAQVRSHEDGTTVRLHLRRR